MELNRTELVNRTERPNSFEFGKAGQRHKVYYEDLEDLKKKIDDTILAEKHLAEKMKEIEVV